MKYICMNCGASDYSHEMIKKFWIRVTFRLCCHQCTHSWLVKKIFIISKIGL